MSKKDDSIEQLQRLVSQFVDDALSAEETAELQSLVRTVPSRLELLVDQLLLDALLTEELGNESLTALVDLVGQDAASSAQTAVQESPQPSTPRRNRSRKCQAFRWMAAMAVIVLIGFVAGRLEFNVAADAAMVVRTAIERHAEPIERVYLVQVERDMEDATEVASPREVRVVTQGDRFYVEVHRGERRWAWGRGADGAVWIAIAPKIGLLIEDDEMGARLQRMSDIYSLNLESLLEDVLRYCRLEHSERGGTHVITATPVRPWRRALRQATIEIDKETKAVRRLVMERETPQHGISTSSFTLVDARLSDESKYSIEGHMEEPFLVLSREMQPQRRRQVLTNWFGESAEHWIATEERNPDAK